jgi:sterol 24-C-methyltransferase
VDCSSESAAAVDLLERVKLAPQGAREVYGVLNTAADSLVQGGQLGLFTPMYFFVARRP